MIKDFDTFINESMNTNKITDVEELCQMFDTESETAAQAKIERILDYLQEWNVINRYNADKLERIFSGEEKN